MLHKVDWDTNQIDQKVTSIDGSLSNVGTTIRAMYDLMKVLGQKVNFNQTTMQHYVLMSTILVRLGQHHPEEH